MVVDCARFDSTCARVDSVISGYLHNSFGNQLGVLNMKAGIVCRKTVDKENEKPTSRPLTRPHLLRPPRHGRCCRSVAQPTTPEQPVVAAGVLFARAEASLVRAILWLFEKLLREVGEA
jgi:hypothetical protein